MVIDTSVFVAARRSRQGAFNALIRRIERGTFRVLASVPLFLEYEAVLTRPEHRMGLTDQQVQGFFGVFGGDR